MSSFSSFSASRSVASSDAFCGSVRLTRSSGRSEGGKNCCSSWPEATSDSAKATPAAASVIARCPRAQDKARW
ncbi:hypothetical protein D3C80_1566830 [compost metagenome]